MTFEMYLNYWAKVTQNKSLTEVLIDKTVFTYHEMVCALVERYKYDVIECAFMVDERTFYKAKEKFKDSSLTYSDKSKKDHVVTVTISGLKEDLINFNNYINRNETTTKD